MNITYRQAQSGKWLVHEAKPHTLGVGVEKVGTPTGGQTTGFQYGNFDTEAEAAEFANELATKCGCTVVEWKPATRRNSQYIDLPAADDDRISINSDKTIEWYRGEVLKNCDITPGQWFGYEFALVDMSTGERLLLSNDGRYQVGDLKRTILHWRAAVDERLGLPRGRNGGRNPIGDGPMERHNIMISASLWRKAAELGDGNASEGVRLALESASV